jgi:hypothetical protein
MDKLIQSAVTLLQSKYNLPSEGFLAGGALANTIFNIVTGKMAPINDIDIYRIIDIKDKHTFEDIRNKQNFQKMELEVYEDYRGMYRGYKNGDYYIIEEVSNQDIINFIDYKTNTRNHQIILDSFDINCCQVGYDLENKKCYYTKDFQEFLETQELRLVNLTSPSHTAIRLIKKKIELDVKLPQLELDAISYALSDINSTRFLDIRKKRFQHRYKDLYHKYESDLNPFFTLKEDEMFGKIFTTQLFYLKPKTNRLKDIDGYFGLSTEFLFWIRNIYQNESLEKKWFNLNLLFDTELGMNTYFDTDISEDKMELIKRLCEYAPNSIKNLRGLTLSKQLSWINTLFDKFQHDPIIAISILEKTKCEDHIDLEDDMTRLLLELSVRKDILEDERDKVRRILGLSETQRTERTLEDGDDLFKI